MGGNIVETLIGAVVLAVAGFFLAFAYSSANLSAGSDGTTLVAEFDRIDGVTMGTEVRMSGIKIGSVIDQRLDTQSYRAVVTMSIANDVPLPDDSSIKVTSEGLLGDTYLAVEPGGSEDLLSDGGRIAYTQGSIDLMSLIGQAIFSTQDESSQ